MFVVFLMWVLVRWAQPASAAAASLPPSQPMVPAREDPLATQGAGDVARWSWVRWTGCYPGLWAQDMGALLKQLGYGEGICYPISLGIRMSGLEAPARDPP